MGFGRELKLSQHEALIDDTVVPGSQRLLPIRSTLVERAANAIVAAAIQGTFLPGARLIEAAIAHDLGISRVPVREALRLLESQGVVFTTPYKSVRLMKVSNQSVGELMRVRLALEVLAMREAAAVMQSANSKFFAVRFERLRAAANTDPRKSDKVDLTAIDVAFHTELCHMSGNALLAKVWEGIVRQLSILWGLMQTSIDAVAATQEHMAIITALDAGDIEAAVATLTTHITWYESFDIEALVKNNL